MFFRKRKKEEDGLGLSAPAVSSGLSVTPSDAPTFAAPDAPTLTPSDAPTFTPPPSTQIPTPATTTAQLGAIPQVQFPTSVPAMLTEILGGKGPIGEMIAQIKANPEAFRQQILARAQAAGISTYVPTPLGMTPSVAQHVDVIDELTKAAELHDKGALTDAEFDALKKKLLAE